MIHNHLTLDLIKITKNIPNAFNINQKIPDKNTDKPFVLDANIPNKIIMLNVNQMANILLCNVIYK